MLKLTVLDAPTGEPSVLWRQSEKLRRHLEPETAGTFTPYIVSLTNSAWWPMDLRDRDQRGREIKALYQANRQAVSHPPILAGCAVMLNSNRGVDRSCACSIRVWGKARSYSQECTAGVAINTWINILGSCLIS